MGKAQGPDDDGGEERVIDFGHPERHPPFADNSVRTSRYTPLSFLPLATMEQFRKVGNIYFLCMGLLMFIGYYTPAFDTAITPWSTLGPLALVIAVSLMQEGYRDVQRHRSDSRTNSRPCVVLRRPDTEEGGKPKKLERDPRLNNGTDMNVRVSGEEVPVAFASVPRKDICAGDLVIVRNREMVPADLILLATSNEGGTAYVETSSIDGETNLKLRGSPRLPVRLPRSRSLFNSMERDGGDAGLASHESEAFRAAVERVVGMSALGRPGGKCALTNPANADEEHDLELLKPKRVTKGALGRIRHTLLGDEGSGESYARRSQSNLDGEDVTYIAALTSEPPNPHVNNYTGTLTLPPNARGDRCENAPLDAENLLLRGAVLRNTEWALGLACFTGADTKLVMNSVATPSKFSQLDGLVNRTVYLILFVFLVCVLTLGGLSVRENAEAFDQLWYAGYNDNVAAPWPYFNLEGSSSISPPQWEEDTPNFAQNVFMFITLLSNFVPLSLYIAVEVVTVLMILFIGWDLRMYHAESDTPAAARSTIVTDLGLVEYIFSDKTGTLTCNIMEFKRCSVDGHAFGRPIAKAAHQQPAVDPQVKDEEDNVFSDFVHPLRNLLAGSAPALGLSKIDEEVEVELNESPSVELGQTADKLSFNAEMFLRVMSICHTVVVEKDPNAKNIDGAPEGYVYQAESPDEGALVSAASKEYGFQVLGRNSSGVQLSCSCPSLLADERVVEGLKSGSLTAKDLVARTAPPLGTSKYSDAPVEAAGATARLETWPILAINKFDSDRKRMSVLVRSPPELGAVPMLLCKGADSSMLAEGVCEGAHVLENLSEANEQDISGSSSFNEGDSEHDALLGLQTHLGEFASEGLRTLVLGVKLLTEEQTEQWLAKFKAASTSIEKRDEKLTSVAYEIEKDMHIVGATAIEDKLQDGVADTIANLNKAGIKLWVLTGDKRETAIEIGYSTKVLVPEMNLTEVVDGPPEKVKARVALELMRHIKIGNLPDYTLAALEETKGFSPNCLTLLGNWWRKMWLGWRLFFLKKIKRCFLSTEKFEDQLEDLEEEMEVEKRRADPRIQRRKVRARAQDIIDSLQNDPKQARATEEEDGPRTVFKRAEFARQTLIQKSQSSNITDQTKTPRMTDSVLVKNLALARMSVTDQGLFSSAATPRQSYLPKQAASKFDKRNRTLLERLFAVDKDMRQGTLSKDLSDEYKEALDKQPEKDEIQPTKMFFDVSSVKRGFVVEGAALKHLLGDPVLEEMLFAVASCSESVIACRVSPIQKALLLKMVRQYVEPTPTTLAIGDGANDVGMIQEAHIGIGVSGLEGQQAVNASDFAIAQFRFLEDLLLVHGRWNFRRMSTNILYFFYKNATLAITMILYSGTNLHSGQLLYDAWVLSMFNFVGGSMSIVMMAVFDRDIPRDYVMRNPQLYGCGPNNEFLSMRMTFRWLGITIIHALTIYYFSAPVLGLGGGSTSSFKGLMGNWNRDSPGDGEGGDLQVFGTTIYSQLIYVVAFKALYETRSVVNGEFPTFTCRSGKGEGWASRMGYSWVGVTWFTVIFYIVFLYVYETIGRLGPQTTTFFVFVDVSQHVMNTRSITWMVSILVPTIAVIFDVTGKVFSNMFYPTQTQIHAEIAAQE